MKKMIQVVQIHNQIRNNSAPNRLRLALQKIGIEPIMLVKQSSLEDEHVRVVKPTLIFRVLRRIDSILINNEYKRRYTRQEGMPFSFYRVGENLSKENIVKQADIIQMEWICGTFISPKGIGRLAHLGKPIVIVCHDNWYFTGGCHVRLGCERFTDRCGKCPQLRSSIEKDWSYRLLEAKKKALRGGNVTVVSPSRWMDKNVANSALLKNYTHYIIPNPINIDIFAPKDRKSLRKKYGIDFDSVILAFGAVNATKIPYKGYRNLLEALDILEKNYLNEKRIEILIFGADHGEEGEGRKIKIHYCGYLEEYQMVELYNCTDIYILPSLEDSFNYTAAESLACETPVVAFQTGGIVDIIDHKRNGYLATYNDSSDLARGIEWIMNHNENNILGKDGRKKVTEKFQEVVVARQYLSLYQQLLGKNK